MIRLDTELLFKRLLKKLVKAQYQVGKIDLDDICHFFPGKYQNKLIQRVIKFLYH